MQSISSTLTPASLIACFTSRMTCERWCFAVSLGRKPSPGGRRMCAGCWRGRWLGRRIWGAGLGLRLVCWRSLRGRGISFLEGGGGGGGGLVGWRESYLSLAIIVIEPISLPVFFFFVSLKQELELSMKQLNSMLPLYGQISWSDNRYYNLCLGGF